MLEREIAYKLGLAERRIEVGDTRGAIDALRGVLTLDPSLAIAHALLASALLSQKRLHAAEHEASLALALEPESAFAHRVLGLVSIARRQPRRAREHIEQALSLAPDDAVSHRASAFLHAASNDRAAERAALEKACELDAEDPDNLAALGRWHLGAGKLDEAERLGRDALACEPEHAGALVLLGHVLLARGRTEEARDHALWVLRNSPADGDALLLLSAVKARKSFFLGLWWRFNSWVARYGDSRIVLLLTGAYALERVLVMAAFDHGMPMTAEIVSYAWLAVCVYSWVGPLVFQRSVRAELRQVRLSDGF